MVQRINSIHYNGKKILRGRLIYLFALGNTLSTKEAEYSNLINRMNIRINIGTDNKSCKDITENPFSEFQAQIHFINFTIEMNVLTIAVICVIALMNRTFLINSNNDNNIKFLSGNSNNDNNIKFLSGSGSVLAIAFIIIMVTSIIPLFINNETYI
ncbi:hypothetical protein H8356DRAFT_1422596 [Neocallimastix lanati (nom. inval.)]|nr:hypothetical protein H8356DRAFT_1422596 [Neocallimastix sp. JGI-2020a]